MRRIIVLTAGYGEGHNSAARNLCAALNRRFGVHATVHDPLEAYGEAYERSKRHFVNAVTGAPLAWLATYHALDRLPVVPALLPFLGRARRRLSAILKETGADIAVCSHPIFPGLLRDIARAGGPAVKVVTVVTDSISINRVWAKTRSDLWLAADRYSAARLRRLGVPSSGVRTTGFPTPSAFAANPECERLAPFADGGRARVLLMAGSASRDTVRTARALAALPDIELTVSVGRHAELVEHLYAALEDTGHSARIIGWTSDLPALLRSSHIVLGKAGGATTHETLAARTPFVITQVLPGQEQGNAELIRRLGVGDVAGDPAAAAEAVTRMLADDARLWRSRVERLERFARPDSSSRAADAVLSL